MKRKQIILLAIFSLIFSFLPVTNPISHADGQYRITGYSALVNLDSSGNAMVEERVTYLFDGHFNGIYLNIGTEQTSGLVNPEIFKLVDGQQSAFEPNDSGESGSYQVTRDGDTYKFKIFEASENEEKTFVLKYTLQDVVTKQVDIAEFNRKMVGTGWAVTLENVVITVVIPEGAAREQLKVYAHGQLTGTSEITDNRTFTFTASDVAPGEFVETRVLFPKDLVPKAVKTGTDTLSDIVQQETIEADKANQVREDARRSIEESNRRAEEEATARYAEVMRNKAYGNILIPAGMLLWLFIMVYFYIKFDREPKSSFEAKYYRELPGEYTPAEMSVLVNSGNVSSRDIMATLLDLMRKSVVTLDSVTYDEKRLFGTKKRQEYQLTLIDASRQTSLKAHEAYLLDWFIGLIGNGNEVLLGDISEYASNRKTGLEFKSSYDKWCQLVKNEAGKNNFFDATIQKGKVIGCLFGLVYLGAGILGAVYLTDLRYALIAAGGFILMIYSLAIHRRTAYGNEQYKMWQAFRRFLKDFSHMEKAEIPAITLWEHYLVYAVSLGVAKEVIKQLPIIFREEEFNNSSLMYFNVLYYSQATHGFDSFERAFNDTMHSMESSVSSAESIASSQDSSGSGGGGGFSGGSSGGGGGSSGGGAF